MKKLFSFRSVVIPEDAPRAVIVMALLAMLLHLPAVRAFPPAQDCLIYGVVKDQYGTPLVNSAARVLLVSSNGTQLATSIAPGLAIGINFALSVPMDAGVTPDPYTPNALTAGTPYKLYVVIGSTTNLPIEMTKMANGYALMGQPAQQTRLDLTLGVDSNGDGIPDAWEKEFLASIGTNIALANLNLSADYAHDGRTLKQEYLLGNYPLNPEDSFNVRLISLEGSAPLLEFTTMLGRSYAAFGSADLKSWTALSFTVPADGQNAAVRSYYYAPDIRTLRVRIIVPSGAPQMQFFKLQLN